MNTQQLIKTCLDEYNAKPLLPLELTSINNKLADPATSLESFKIDYKRDPIFCWELVKAGWQATKNKASHPFGADHAMSAIGMGNAKNLFMQADNAPQQLSQEVIFNLSCSLLAAELSHQLTASDDKRPQMYWSGLFHQLPDTLLWYLRPKVMWKIHYQNLTTSKDIDTFEQAQLGFQLQEWRIEAADFFAMSEQNKRIYNQPLINDSKQLVEYMNHGYSNKTLSLKAWHKNDDWLVILSNQLAQAIMSPWHHNAVVHCVKRLKQYLPYDSKKLNQLIQNSIYNVSKALHHSKLMVPAMGFIMSFSKPIFPSWLNKPAATPPNRTLQNLVKKLTQNAHEFNNTAELINECLTAIITQLKFSRVAFIAIDHKSKVASTRMALSAPNKPKIRPEFEFKTPVPFSQFIEKQALMVFSHKRHQKIWGKLPLEIQKQRVQEFVLCSLKPGKQVRALIYLDTDDPTCFSPKYISKVKILLQALNKGLMQRNAPLKANAQKQANTG